MKKTLFLFATAGTMALIHSAAGAAPLQSQSKQSPDARAAAVEQQMTEDERFQLLHSIMPFNIPGLPKIDVEGLTPTAGYIRGIPRLGIPDLYETDASLGVTNPLQLRKGDVSTALPASILTAATFSRELAHAGGVVIGRETRAKGFNVLLAGGVNLTREPRNGRNFEYLGEDPLLAGTLAGAAIDGIQSQKVVSTVKHYVLNSQETLRSTIDARISEAALRMSDLLAFEIAIEKGKPGAVMCAYNQINGDYACGNDFLLNKVLKQDWGYKGWVMSDWGAVHNVDYFMKGLDQQSGAQLDKQIWFDGPLKTLVKAGKVPPSRVSDAVRRVLRSLYATGADIAVPRGDADMDAHAAEARKVAEAGIVLLKNEGDILPLMQSARRVAVIGGHADRGVLSGAGSSQVTPKGDVTIIPVGGTGAMASWARMLFMPSSPVDALRKALPDTSVNYDSGYVLDSAAALAANADVAIVFATQWSSEGFDGSLALPEGQDELIARVAAANPNTIVVLETGNPVKMPWIDQVKAVVEAWYPGQEGGTAIANVLTGAVNPGGHLPITFPKDESQLPNPELTGFGKPEGSAETITYPEGAKVGYRWYAAKGLKPLFPFGYGLSYTSFAYSDLRLSGGAAPKVSVTVTNSGKRAGSDVPQLYLTARNGEKIERLVGFDRVELRPGESRTVSMTIDPRLLADWTGKGWTVQPGTYSFAAGHSATDFVLTGDVKLSGQTLRP